jgi:hypothetical protein
VLPEAGVRKGAVRLDQRAVAALAIVLLAFGLRLFRLGYQSLWMDEATSAYLTTLSPVQIVLNRANNLHPPTYFLALAGWAALAGRSEFALRFFSVWTGLLLVPLMYRIGRRLFSDARTGLLAALLAALSPAGVVYAQETRMYVMLPVAYIVVLACVLAPGGLRTRRDWVGFTLSELACLYLHFFSIFIVLAVNLLLLAMRMRCASRRTWRRWGTSLALVGLSYAPWLLAVWRWGMEVPGKLSRRDWRAVDMSLTRFLRLVWEFLNTGLLGASKVDLIAHWPGVLGVLILAALLLVLLFDPRRRTLLAAVGAFLLPLAGAYPVWFMRPLAHPRYLLFLLAPLLVVLARLLAVLCRRPVVWIVSMALAGVILSSDVVVLGLAFFDARFFRFDMCALAAAIADRAAPGEAVVMPPADYSLWYYDSTPAEPVNLPGESGAEGGRLRLEELGPLLAGRPGAFLVTYRDLRAADPRGQVPYLLETNGRLVERFSIDRIDVARYELEGWTLPEPTLVAARCGPLMLTGVYSQAVAMADNAVTVALRWRLEQPTEEDYKVTVRLWDGERQLAGADVRLLNDLGRPTNWWQAGEEALNVYVLPVPLGTPPLTYTLSVALYGVSGGHNPKWDRGGRWLALGSVRLLQAVNQVADPYGSWGDVAWVSPVVSEVCPGLLLEGYTVRPAALEPGDVMYPSLRWRAARDDLAQCTPSLVLQQGETVLTEDAGSLFARYPTERWAAGELLIETRELPVPPTLSPLELALKVDGRTVPVGEVAVTRKALAWEVPASAQPACARLDDVAKLAGYEWAVDSEKPDRGALTLYWRAPADSPAPESYMVFTHLLSADGTLLAQHDGPPGEGEKPTDIWVPDEVIADRHRLWLGEPYTGPVRLVVGMYELATLDRLPAYDCAGQRLPGDAIPLVEFSMGEAP